MSKSDLAVALAPLLTQDEFRTAYAIQWTAHSYGAYGAENMTPEVFDETFDHLGGALVFGVLRLHEGGHVFKALRIDDRGELFPLRGAPTTPGNVLYVNQLAVGRPINFLLMIQAALDLIERESLGIDADPLRHAQDEIRKALEETRAQVSQEMSEKDIKKFIAARRKELALGESISRAADRGELPNAGTGSPKHTIH